jgi:signal transduction histidine kinase
MADSPDHSTSTHNKSAFFGIDQWLGRQSTSFAVIFLTSFATISGALLSLTFYGWFYGPPPLGLYIMNPLISAVVAAPIIYYSQLIIRNLARAKRELAALTDRLSIAYEGAEAANRAKSVFLTNMSHELRTPLNVVIGFSDILINDKRDASEKRFEYYQDIKSSGEHLLSIINDILDISRIEAGHSEMLEEVIDLNDALNRIKRMMTPIAEQKNITLTIDRQENLPDLRGNERLVRQMILNLVSNAVKFTPKGGSVSVSVDRVPASWLRITVIDTGIGMSLPDIDRALLLFGQADETFSRGHQGAGLGLPLTNTMIERHGGVMIIDSEVDKGTRVTLQFPPERVVEM